MKSEGAETIFFAALEKADPAERVAFVNEACGTNAALRCKVEKLLAAHPEVNSFLSEPALGRDSTVEGPALQEGPGTRIGPYKLLQQIGEGGFGVVYMAEQVQPVRRKVALKVIKPGLDTRSVVARFEAERQALAMMDHPNIAHVLDAGATNTGRPYFVMDLVKGVPITEYCDKNRLDTRQRLALFITVCQAVQHAHQKGVIHRDLKPANIMVTLHDGKPVPKVIDFGVSKALSQQLTEKTLFTAYGQMIGTPQYMSPEQAEMSGLDIDTRSDIYSLGVLLYELLTGKTPLENSRLRAAGYAELQRMICEEEPPTPSTRLSTLGDESTVIAQHRSVEPKQLRQLLRGDLDWIVMKALNKERGRRYDTAIGLADDIERFLSDEAVEARPPSTAYKLRKFLRRNKGPVAAAVAVSIVLIAGIIGTTIGLFRAEKAATEATKQAERATLLAREAHGSEQRASREAERFRRLSYLSDVSAALPVWQMGDAGRAADLLKRHLPKTPKGDLRGFEWYYVFALCQRSLMAPKIECTSSSVAYSPDGTVLAFGDGDRAKLMNIEHGRITEVVQCAATVSDIAFSLDGEMLAVADSTGEILLWDVNAGKSRSSLVHGSNVLSIAFSPDGGILASSCLNTHQRNAKLWDRNSGEVVQTLEHEVPATSVAFSSDGKTVATCDWKGTLILWNRDSYDQRTSVLGHSGPAMCVTFSPRGDALVSAGVDGTVKLWSTVEGDLHLLRTFQGHTGSINDVAFSPGEQILASGGIDNTVRLWDLATGEEIDTFRGSAPITAVAFDPASAHTLASASHDGIQLWDTSKRPAPDVLTGFTGEVCFGAFSPNEPLFVSCGWDGIIRFWDTRTWELREELPPQQQLYCVAISPDGTTLAYAGEEGTIRLWNLKTHEPAGELPGHPGAVWCVAFDPLGEKLVSAGEGGHQQNGGTVRIWDVIARTEIEQYRYDGHRGAARMAIFSPDGRWVASGCAHGRVRLWEIATGRQRILTEDANGLWSLDFSPDGRRLVATAGQRGVMLWDLTTGELHAIEGLKAMVMHVAFLPPDGKALITTGHEGTVRLWNAITGDLQFTFPRVGTGGNYFAFSPDNETIALCCRDATIRLLHAASEEDVHAAGWYQDIAK